MAEDPIELSVIVPVLNERDNIRALYEQLAGALDGRFNYEIIAIDDGSTDDSFALLKELHERDPRLRVIRFRRNFGQTAAMAAGIEYARGAVIVPIDADLQNDPADIPKLMARLDEGYDVVSGWRKNRQDAALTRLLPSWIANRIIAWITGVKVHDFGCTLKAYRREVVTETRLYGEMHRFIPAVANWAGARICEMAVNHRPRTAGKSKYGLSRTVKVMLDLITIKFLGTFSTKPIYVFGGLGSGAGGLAVIAAVATLYMKFAEDFSMNRNPLMYLSGILFVAAIQFILMGLLAEMIVRTYHESQNRRTYVIREILDGKPHANETLEGEVHDRQA